MKCSQGTDVLLKRLNHYKWSRFNGFSIFTKKSAFSSLSSLLCLPSFLVNVLCSPKPPPLNTKFTSVQPLTLPEWREWLCFQRSFSDEGEHANSMGLNTAYLLKLPSQVKSSQIALLCSSTVHSEARQHWCYIYNRQSKQDYMQVQVRKGLSTVQKVTWCMKVCVYDIVQIPFVWVHSLCIGDTLLISACSTFFFTTSSVL